MVSAVHHLSRAEASPGNGAAGSDRLSGACRQDRKRPAPGHRVGAASAGVSVHHVSTTLSGRPALATAASTSRSPATGHARAPLLTPYRGMLRPVGDALHMLSP